MQSAQFDPVYPRKNPCPCGSGKKFKNCCEGIVSIDTRKLLAAEKRNPGTISGIADALDQEIERRKNAV